MNMPINAPVHCFAVGKFVTFQENDRDYDGLIEKVSDVGALLAYFDQGKEKKIAKFFCDMRLTDQTVNDWWETFLNPGDESVLGDSREIDPLKIDAIGRGKKGYGHGSIDWKPIERKRKSGRVWTTKQPWYQWEDEKGKHCRYLRKGTDLAVQRLIDEGSTVEQILESISLGDKNEKRKKTR